MMHSCTLFGVALAVVLAPPLRSQAPGGEASVEGVVRAGDTGRPIFGVEVRAIAPGGGRTVHTDSAGAFAIPSLPPGKLRLQAIAVGFKPYEVTVRVPREGTLRLDIALEVRVAELPNVDVSAAKLATTEEAHARELFERQVLPAATTLSSNEMRSIPTIAEPDVMRALQALPGIVAINDLDAQPYVRGGSSDQNLFLLDGAPVYGAYHLFGMNGAFNPDAIEHVDFFRGARSARYGGALSSVVDISQAEAGPRRTVGGLSLIGARLTQRGSIGEHVAWMASGRRTHTDALIGGRMPFGFYDAQTKIVAATAGHELTLSGFASGDRFEMFFDSSGGGEFRSRWKNAAGSARWRTPRWRGWISTSALWASRYDATLNVGADDSATLTAGRLAVSGARWELERGSAGAQLRAGTEIQRTHSTLAGTVTSGSYFAGRDDRALLSSAAYLEGERRVGAVRVAPGVRVVRGASSGVLVEPRLALRIGITDDVSLTVGASRDHQFLATLRDERTMLPGPQLWFLSRDDAPPARADGLSAEITAWAGDGFTASLGAYAKRLSAVPHWRPEGARDLSSVSYDNGRADGIELSVRRFGRVTSGWLGYAYSRAHFVDASTGVRYEPVSDRRHSANAALATRPLWNVSLMTQASVGSGLPLWPFVGDVSGPSFSPAALRLGMVRQRLLPLWGDRQIRQPTYARVDVGIRKPFAFRGGFIEPYINVQNVGYRANVIGYKTRHGFNDSVGSDGKVLPAATYLDPIALPVVIIPTFGIDVRF